jgi:TP901 family phage tail tape measure protein
MANLTSTLSVRLKDGVSGPAHKAAQSIRTLDRTAKNAKGGTMALAASTRSLALAGSALEGAGLAMAARGGGIAAVAVGAGMALNKAGREALSFERTMYKVEKATDSSGAQAQKFADDLIRISKQTGKTKEELGEMMAAAGFAGRPVQELAQFTEYAAKATSAWEMNAEQVGQGLAEIGNIYSANQQRIQEIGDAINTAADSSASKESDLLEFLRRAGASAKVAGIGAEQTLAFGAALKEVGVSTDVAATGFEALLNMMKLGEEFSTDARGALIDLGISSDKMRKQFFTKPVESILGLLGKIQKVKDPAKRAEILTNLFGKEYQDDIQKLINQLPRINTLLGTMGNKANYVGSVDKGFDLWQEKDFAKIERAERAWDSLMTRLGRPIKLGLGWGAEQAHAALDGIEARLDGISRKYEEGGLKALLTPTAAETTAEGERLKNEQAAVAAASQDLYGDDRLERSWDMARSINEAQQRARRMAEDKAYALDQEIARKRQNLEAERSQAQRSLDANRQNFGTRSAIGAGLERKGVTRLQAAESALAELEAAAAELGAVRARVQAFSAQMNRALNPTVEGFRSQREMVAPTLGAGASFGFGRGGTPAIDTTGLEAAKGKAAEAGQAVQSLNTTVSPTVDLASLDAAQAKADRLLATLNQIGGASRRAASAASQISVPTAAPAAQQAASRDMGRQFEARRRGSYADYEHA